MKSVLISIQPKWVEKIASGEKTIEVRKTKPNLGTPFKVYIYCTKGKDLLREVDCWNTKAKIHTTNYKIINLDYCTNKIANGKVIGEFVCDKIDRFYCASVPYRKENNLGYEYFVDNGVYKVNGWHDGVVFERNDIYIDSMLKNNELKEMCLSAQEIFDYIGIGKHLYGWHISDLKIYDKPKELSEFKRWNRTEDNVPCAHVKWIYPDCKDCKACNLTKPPQSWCYVEELQNG